MATDHTVPFTLAVSTVGTESVTALQKEVKALAREGGSAAPEFERLAGEIAKLGQQTELVATTRALSNEITGLKNSEADAAAKAALMVTELGQLSLATQEAAGKQAAAKAAVDALKVAQFENTQATKALRIENQAAGATSDANRIAMTALKTTHLENVATLRTLTSSFNDAKAVTSQATTAENEYASRVAFATKELNAAKAALAARNDSLRGTLGSLEAAGVATTELSTAEAHLLKVYNESVTALNAAAAAQRAEVAGIEAAKTAKSEYSNLIGVLNAKIVAGHKAAADAATLAANQTAAAEAKVVAAAKESSAAISNALGSVGVKSATALQAEINKVKAAMQLLASDGVLTGKSLQTAFTAGNAQIKALERDLRAANGELTMGDKAAKMFSGSMASITGGMLASNAVMFLVTQLTNLAVGFKNAVVQGDQMRRGLTAVYGSAEVAAKQIEFLKIASSETGVEFGALSQDFVRFSASMKSANIPLNDSNNLFKAVTGSAAALGLGTEATAGALNALGQMASKGTVSMEELRQQLGDRLPGVMGLTAKGFGITEAALVKLVASGQLATVDFIVPFTNALNTLQGETDGIVPTFDRFIGLLKEVSMGMGDAGAVTVFTAALKVFGGVVGYCAWMVSSLWEGLMLLGKGFGALAARISGQRGVWDEFGKDVELASARLGKQHDALIQMISPAERAADITNIHAKALVEFSDAALKAGPAGEEFSRVNGLIALKTKLAADATLDVSTRTVQFAAAAAAVLAAQEAQTLAFEKGAKAAKVQGDALVALASITGDVTEKDTALVAASVLHATAIDKVTKSIGDELAVLELEKVNQLEGKAAKDKTVEQLKAISDATDKLIVKKKAELDQSVQNGVAAQAEILTRKLTVAALADNANALSQYETNVNFAKAALSELLLAEQRGQSVAPQILQAREQLAKSVFLYRDAIADSIAKLDAESKSRSASISLGIAEVGSRKSMYDALALEARAHDNVKGAVDLEIKSKEASMQMVKLEMALKTLQFQAAEAEIVLKRKLINADTDEGKQKLALLDIELQIIKVKEVQNGMASATLLTMEAEIKRLKDNANGVFSVVDAYKQLGITSPGEMAKIAAANQAAWKTISAASNTSVSTLIAAFRAYGDSALTAAGKVGNSQRIAQQEMLVTEGAARGLTITFDKMGQMAVNGQVSIVGAVGDTNASLLTQANTLGMVANEWGVVETAALKAESASLAASRAANSGSGSGARTVTSPLGGGFEVPAGLYGSGTMYKKGTTKEAIFDDATTAGLSDTDAAKIATKYEQGGYKSNDGFTNDTGFGYSTEQHAQIKIYENVQAAIAEMLAQTKKNDLSTRLKDATKPPPTTTNKSSESSTTVNINIGGIASKINVSSASDAATLQQILQQLAAAQGRSI